MSNNLPARSGFFDRRWSRELARAEAHTDLEVAYIGQVVDKQAACVAGVTYVGKRAMHEVAMLSQLEQQLAMLVPTSAPRLQALGDIVALGAADIVSNTVRKVTR